MCSLKTFDSPPTRMNRRSLLLGMLLVSSCCRSFPFFCSRRFATGMSFSAPTTVNVYPLSHRNQLDISQNVKTVHMVRHAQGTHNITKDYGNRKHLDARLTDYGLQQCASLASQTPSLIANDDALVVTSIMTRCIQTALLSFPHMSKSFVAHESIRETVNFASDQRRVLDHLMEEFHPRVDFSHVAYRHDELWRRYDDWLGQDYSGHRESAQLYKVAERGREFLTWLQGREETEVVVCSHEAFLRCILNWGQEGGVPFMPEQHLDDRISEKEGSVNVPLFRYHGSGEFEAYMRRSYDNCELRSFLLSFSSDIP